MGVEGRLQQRSFTRQDGSKGSTFEVVCNNVEFLERREQDVTNEEVDVPPFDDIPAEEEKQNLDSIEITDDDLPF